MREGIAAMQALGIGGMHFQPYYLALLAELHAKAGNVEQGLTSLAEARALVEQHEEPWCEAELLRIKGELLLIVGEDAEAALERARAVACVQQAKSLELRAATRLARLWQQQGKSAEARQMLAEIYDWFTEGFDMPDLQDARVLLEQL
jgi:predicted ATPase